nr:BTAD domain-containing putative transcriptional regulator [Phytoactinopolyspora mesophila]
MPPLAAVDDRVAGRDAAPGTAGQRDSVQTESDGHGAPGEIYEVVPGDTLWDIAEQHLNDPTRHPEIFAENRDVTQPDGRTLTDPDLIHPGWQLVIPGDADDDAGDDVTADDDASDLDDGQERDGRRDQPETDENVDESDPADDGASSPDVPPNEGREENGYPEDDEVASGWLGLSDAEEPADAAGTGVENIQSSVQASDDSGLMRVVATTTGVGAVLAAGLIGLIGARRSRQQRRRKSGQRLPEPDTSGTALEAELRDVSDPAGADFVDQALRTLAARLGESGDPLPALRAARLTEDQFEVYLTEPANLPEPFVGTMDGGVWVLVTDTEDLLDGESAQAIPAPYPGLVTLGQDLEGGHLMLDLEHLGALRVTGDATAIEAFLTAVALEYATSRWADDIQVTLVGRDIELEALNTGRIRRAQDADQLLRELEVRAQADRELMGHLRVNGLAAARTGGGALEASTPEIVLISRPLPEEHWRRLAALLSTEPKVALAIVASGAEMIDDGLGGDWELRVDSARGAVIEPLGITVRPQQVDSRTYEQIARLVEAADAELLGAGEPELRLDDIPIPTSEARLSAGQYVDVGTLVRGDTSDTAVDQTEQDKLSLAATDAMLRDGDVVKLAQEEHPRVLLLGEPDVAYAKGSLESSKRGQGIQIAAYLSLRPGRSGPAMDEAIWPGRRLGQKTRDTAVSKLRRWLGTNEAGEPYLPYAVKDYRLHADVRSDWQDWCEMVGRQPREATTENLRTALDLVRGRPFSGIRSGAYAWADIHAQEMIASIVDVCHVLAERAMGVGDLRGAQMATLLGLDIEPGSELLWRARLKAEVRLGDPAQVVSMIRKLRELAEQLWGDLEDETVELIDQIEERLSVTGSAARGVEGPGLA